MQRNIIENLTVRRAVASDCPRLLELIQGLADYEKMPDDVTVDLGHFVDSGFGEAPVWWAFVAEENGHIHGFALYFIRYSTWKGQQMYLEDIYVDPPARGKGIGRKLFDRLIEEARERKFNAIKWQALKWNEPAINFYRKYYGAQFDDEWINCGININAVL